MFCFSFFLVYVVILAEAVALVAASTVHRVCITTCLLFSVGLLYEINKLSVMMASKGDSKAKRY
nr:protein KRTCAP2 homolog [Ipomoea batatas]